MLEEAREQDSTLWPIGGWPMSSAADWYTTECSFQKGKKGPKTKESDAYTSRRSSTTPSRDEDDVHDIAAGSLDKGQEVSYITALIHSEYKPLILLEAPKYLCAHNKNITSVNASLNSSTLKVNSRKLDKTTLWPIGIWPMSSAAGWYTTECSFHKEKNVPRTKESKDFQGIFSTPPFTSKSDYNSNSDQRSIYNILFPPMDLHQATIINQHDLKYLNNITLWGNVLTETENAVLSPENPLFQNNMKSKEQVTETHDLEKYNFINASDKDFDAAVDQFLDHYRLKDLNSFLHTAIPKSVMLDNGGVVVPYGILENKAKEYNSQSLTSHTLGENLFETCTLSERIREYQIKHPDLFRGDSNTTEGTSSLDGIQYYDEEIINVSEVPLANGDSMNTTSGSTTSLGIEEEEDMPNLSEESFKKNEKEGNSYSSEVSTKPHSIDEDISPFISALPLEKGGTAKWVPASMSTLETIGSETSLLNFPNKTFSYD